MTSSPRSEGHGHGHRLEGHELDPFDLPEWLGTDPVTWSEDGALGSAELRTGALTGPHGQALPCDLVAVDASYPQPVVDEAARIRAHHFWVRGEVLLLSVSERPTLAVPGTSFQAEWVLEALSRLARSVGADPARYVALLSVAAHRPGGC